MCYTCFLILQQFECFCAKNTTKGNHKHRKTQFNITYILKSVAMGKQIKYRRSVDQICAFLLTADPTIDEIVRSQISHQASIPMSRQPTQRHILEVSAAQQRQQDVLTQARRHVRAPCTAPHLTVVLDIIYIQRFDEAVKK